MIASSTALFMGAFIVSPLNVLQGIRMYFSYIKDTHKFVIKTLPQYYLYIKMNMLLTYLFTVFVLSEFFMFFPHIMQKRHKKACFFRSRPHLIKQVNSLILPCAVNYLLR